MRDDILTEVKGYLADEELFEEHRKHVAAKFLARIAMDNMDYYTRLNPMCTVVEKACVEAWAQKPTRHNIARYKSAQMACTSMPLLPARHYQIVQMRAVALIAFNALNCQALSVAQLYQTVECCVNEYRFSIAQQDLVEPAESIKYLAHAWHLAKDAVCFRHNK